MPRITNAQSALAPSAGLFCAMLAATALAGPAQAIASPAPGITGVWLLTPSEYDRRDDMPLTAQASVIDAAQRKAVEEQGQVLSDNAKRCLPIGMPTFMVNEFALEILETKDRVTMVSEYSPLARSIYLGEKTHTPDLEPSWNGHSIGHWQGRTLVVDTVNFNDRLKPVSTAGIHSPTTHLVEKIYLKSPDTLVDEMTFDDPNVLTRPWTKVHTYHRVKPPAELWEYVCEADAPGWSQRYAGDPPPK